MTIPPRAVLAGRRRTAYVSPSTASMQFTAMPGNLVTDVNLSGSVCTTLGSGKTCRFSVAAPVGNDTFTVVAYDQPFTGTTLPMGAQALAGQSSFSATVVEGAGNVTVPLITGGVPSTIALSFADGTTSASLGLDGNTKPLTVTTYDADGNVIVVPGAFSNASGTPTPIVITSAVGSSSFGYAVTSGATGTTGAAGATITLAEPNDTVALVSTAAYVPPSDTLTLPSGVTVHGSGTTTVPFTFGYRFTPGFTPALLAPMDGPIEAAVGHRGIITAAQPNRIGFEGDVTASCSSATATALGGISLDPGASTTDTNVYVSANDSLGYIRAIQFSISGLIAGTCGGTVTAASFQESAGGFAAYGGNGYAAGSVGGPLDAYAFAPLLGLGTIHETGIQSTLFTPRAIAARKNGDGLVLVAEKRRLTELNGTAGTVASRTFGTITDGYPFGVTVDTTNDVIYAHDTTSSTFGSNGGIDSFSSLSGSPTGSAQLNGGLSENTSSYQNQNMAVGPRGSGSALYVLCSDGIEVFPVTSTGFSGTNIAPVATIATPSVPTNIVANFDGRLWLVLSDGSIDVLPPQ